MFFFFKQNTAYEMRISDWSSDVCSSDLHHLDLGGALDDVLVGDDEAFGSDDDAGAERRLLALPPPLIVRPAAEEAAEEGIVEQRGNRALLDLALGEDVDHRRRRLLDHRQIGRASCRERVCQYV